MLENGQRMAFGALLIATGAEPVRLPIPGGEAANVHYLRSFADSQAIIADAKDGARAVVAGASFIGLEVAASLRTRGVHVDVVAPEPQPLAKVLGPELGRLIRGLHEAHGVTVPSRDDRGSKSTDEPCTLATETRSTRISS